MPKPEIAALHSQPVATRPMETQPDGAAMAQPHASAGSSQSHIEAIATLLGLSEAQLQGIPAPATDVAGKANPDSATRTPLEAVARLLRAFVSIKDSALRERIVAMTEALVAGEATAQRSLRAAPLPSTASSIP